MACFVMASCSVSQRTQSPYIIEDAMHNEFPVLNKMSENEHWYFDARLDNGDYFVAMYMSNDHRLDNPQPSVRANIYESTGNEIAELQVIDTSKVTVDYDRCNVKMGDNYCIDHGNYFEVYSKINGNGAHLKYYPQHPSWSKSPSKFGMGWTVAIPYANVEGFLFKDGKKIPIKGKGYHDHNWDTKPMKNKYEYWYWGKVHTEEISIVYAVLVPLSGKKPITALLVTDKNGTIIKPSAITALFKVNTQLTDFKREEELGLSFANSLNIIVKKGEFRLNVDVELDRIVKKRGPLHNKGKTAYRYISNNRITIENNGIIKEIEDNNSLHEVVYLVTK